MFFRDFHQKEQKNIKKNKEHVLSWFYQKDNQKEQKRTSK